MLTNQSLKVILHKPKTFRRLVKWSVELNEFDIEYHPWRAIKGQTVINFIAEYTHKSGGKSRAQEEEPGGEEADQPAWVVYIDGSSTRRAVRR